MAAVKGGSRRRAAAPPPWNLRVGFGYDAHRLDARRPLVLAGVTFPDCPGLAGHSDADVLTHAVIDAILAASGAGDIGELFPDTDERWRGASSLDLLKRALPAGVNVIQVDATLVCDRPKILPRRAEMIASLRRGLGDRTAISLKGKTSEGLGFIGRGEGIVAFAVALVEVESEPRSIRRQRSNKKVPTQ